MDNPGEVSIRERSVERSAAHNSYHRLQVFINKQAVD